MQDKCSIQSFDPETRSTFIGIYDGHSTTIIADKLASKLHLEIFENYSNTKDMRESILKGFRSME